MLTRRCEMHQPTGTRWATKSSSTLSSARFPDQTGEHLQIVFPAHGLHQHGPQTRTETLDRRSALTRLRELTQGVHRGPPGSGGGSFDAAILGLLEH